MPKFRSRPILRRLAAIAALVTLAPALGANAGVQTFDDQLLAEQNKERLALGLVPFEWDAQLAEDAAAWARHLTRVGRLVHSESDPRDSDPQGENLWAGTKGYYSAADMVGLWNVEKRNYRHTRFPMNSTTGKLDDVAHYTQIVWRSSRGVGCAVAQGAEDDFLVCRYSEGGNVIGEMPY